MVIWLTLIFFNIMPYLYKVNTFKLISHFYEVKKINWSRYRPGVAQKVGRGIALLSHDRGTRRGWVVSSMPRPHFTPGIDPVPILQETGWAPGPVWTGGKSRPHRDSIPDRPDRSHSLYRQRYPAHNLKKELRITCLLAHCRTQDLPYVKHDLRCKSV